jgi:hypothetical protein
MAVTSVGGQFVGGFILTHRAWPANIQGMAHSFLIFDFGTDEDAAQKARHRIEGWKQAFRLDKKLQVKFERQESEAKPVEVAAAPAKAAAAKPAAKGKSKTGEKSKSSAETTAENDSAEAPPSKIRLLVRLDFSDHEKLSRQRWIERIPADELFKDAHPQIVRAGETEFQPTSDLFDSLD